MVGYDCLETLSKFMELERELASCKNIVCYMSHDRMIYELKNDLKDPLVAEMKTLRLKQAKLEVKMKERALYEFMRRENWTRTPWEYFSLEKCD